MDSTRNLHCDSTLAHAACVLTVSTYVMITIISATITNRAMQRKATIPPMMAMSLPPLPSLLAGVGVALMGAAVTSLNPAVRNVPSLMPA